MPGFVWQTNMKMTPARLNNVQRAIKSINQQYLSDTSLNNDDDLFATLQPNSSYIIEWTVFCQSPAAADIKFAWSGVPVGSNGFYEYESPGFATPTAQLWGATVNVNTAGAPAIELFTGSGGLVTGLAGGTLRLQHAQLVSTATATIIYAGSWLRATLV